MLRSTLILFIFSLLACTGAKSEKKANARNGPPEGRKIEKNARRAAKGEGIIRCFAYHRFGNGTYPSTNISLERFETHLKFLEANDYEVLTLGEALDRSTSQKDLPEKTAVLTMDDGYSSIMSGALPLLQEYGYRASIFVCTEYVGAKNNLSWEELETLQEEGFEIGNHSHSHAHFVELPKDSFRKDLERSEARFKEHLGKKPELYAYPYGEYEPSLKRVLKKKGYQGAVAQRSGVIHRNSDRFELPRFPMTSFYGKAEKFKEKAKMYPLRVEEVSPEQQVIGDNNPPELRANLEKGDPDPDAFQCFVDGGRACAIEVEEKEEQLELKMRSKKKLEDRRTLYTITAPSQDGERWYWYSKLWIRTDREE